MRIHNDADTTIGVRWYFAEDDAPWLNSYTRFASRNWDSQKGATAGIGEVGGAPRPFSNGIRPTGLVGDHICGTLRMFAEGGSVDDPKICTNLEGVSSCCVDKVFCCDVFNHGPQITLTLAAIETLPPGSLTVGIVGTQYTLDLVSVGPPLHYAKAGGFPFGHPSLPMFIDVFCNDNVLSFSIKRGLFADQRFSDNAKPKPFGIRWQEIASPLTQPFVLAESWFFITDTDPGPKAPPPPPTPGPSFPPGTFPPRFFPPGTFP